MNLIKRLYFLFPAFVHILLYSQSIYFDSAWSDDQMVISPQAKDFNLMLKSFYDNKITFPGVHYIPALFLQCFFINLTFGKNAFPFGFHLYHFFVQAVICMLATILIYKLTNNRLIALLIVTFWTVHPVNVQMLTRLLVGPGICGFAACLAFILIYLKCREIKNKLALFALIFSANLLYLFSSFCGEALFLLGFIVYVIFFYLYGKSIISKKYFYLLFPVFIVAPIYLTLRCIACGQLVETGDVLIKWTETGSLKEILFRTFWLSPQLIVHYFKLFFFPTGLVDSRAEWYTVGDSVWSSYSIFCQLFVLCLILAAIFLYKKIPLFTIGIIWFFLSIVLTIQIFPLFSIAALRYFYVPMLGLLLAIFSFVIYFWKYVSTKYLIVLLLPIFCFLILRTLYYIPSGKNSLNFYVYNSKEAPLWNKPIWFYNALSVAELEDRSHELPEWLNEKSFESAIDEWLEKYLNLKTDLSYQFGPMQMTYNYDAFRVIFHFLFYSKQFKKLDTAFNTALKISDDWLGWHTASSFLKDTKQWQLAWEFLERAISKNPKIKFSYDSNFIEVALNANKFSEAELLVKNYMNLKPKSAHSFLFAGWFYDRFGKSQQALNCFELGISKEKETAVDEDLLYFYAYTLFFKNHMFNEARQVLNILISYNPFNIKAKEELRRIETLQNR